MVVIAIAILRMRHLFAAVMLIGIFSLLSAALFVVLDAVDVAFTEAAVGAGISTILMLGTLALTRSQKTTSREKPLLSLLVVVATGGLLIWGTLDMPPYGTLYAPIHQHVAPRYIQVSGDEIGVPNMVTSILASYRGYDTLGEVTVIFTAGIGVLVLLGRGRRKPNDSKLDNQ